MSNMHDLNSEFGIDAEFDSDTSFYDMLLLTLMGFLVLFMMALLLINPVKTDKNPKIKAEFIVTVTWPKESPDDVDTYVEDPQGNVVSFGRREDGLMHLDRDDLGHKNDIIETPNGIVKFDENREIVTIRGITSGEFVVNVHMYRRLLQEAAENQGKIALETDFKPVKVNVRLDKINPRMTTVMVKDVNLVLTGDEKTAFRFTINKEGDVIDVNSLEKLIATNPKNRQDR